MSETNENVIPAPSVKRNGVTKTLTEAVFSPKSDKHKGKVFFVPELQLPKLEYRQKADGTGQEPILSGVDDLIWAGLDQIVGVMDKGLRGVFGRIAIGIYEDPDNNGEFNMEQFIEEAQDFQAARQSLSDIADELDDLQALQIKYAFDPVFVNAMETKVWNDNSTAIQKKVMEISTKAQQLRAKKDSLENEYQRRAQLRKDRAAAAKIAAKTAVSA